MFTCIKKESRAWFPIKSIDQKRLNRRAFSWDKDVSAALPRTDWDEREMV